MTEKKDNSSPPTEEQRAFARELWVAYENHGLIHGEPVTPDQLTPTETDLLARLVVARDARLLRELESALESTEAELDSATTHGRELVQQAETYAQIAETRVAALEAKVRELEAELQAIRDALGERKPDDTPIPERIRGMAIYIRELNLEVERLTPLVADGGVTSHLKEAARILRLLGEAKDSFTVGDVGVMLEVAEAHRDWLEADRKPPAVQKPHIHAGFKDPLDEEPQPRCIHLRAYRNERTQDDWCPDCGAIRYAETIRDEGSGDGWLRPTRLRELEASLVRVEEARDRYGRKADQFERDWYDAKAELVEAQANELGAKERVCEVEAARDRLHAERDEAVHQLRLADKKTQELSDRLEAMRQKVAVQAETIEVIGRKYRELEGAGPEGPTPPAGQAAAAPVGPWLRTSDRLPDDGDHVLVITAATEEYVERAGAAVYDISTGDFMFEVGHANASQIGWWMPFPEWPPAAPQLMQLAPSDERAGRTIDELIEASSLGTPEAKAIRAQADPALVDRVLKRVDELEAERADPECNCNPLENTGGGHRGDCPAFEPECTCYEMTGGHQPMCPYGVMLHSKKAAERAGAEQGEATASVRLDGETVAIEAERRAPVQERGSSGAPGYRPPGTIAWAEHEQVFERYAARYGRGQSAERIAERGGFGYGEIVMFTGAEPKTWKPNDGSAGHQ